MGRKSDTEVDPRVPGSGQGTGGGGGSIGVPGRGRLLRRSVFNYVEVETEVCYKESGKTRSGSGRGRSLLISSWSPTSDQDRNPPCPDRDPGHDQLFGVGNLGHHCTESYFPLYVHTRPRTRARTPRSFRWRRGDPGPGSEAPIRPRRRHSRGKRLPLLRSLYLGGLDGVGSEIKETQSEVNFPPLSLGLSRF